MRDEQGHVTWYAGTQFLLTHLVMFRVGECGVTYVMSCVMLLTAVIAGDNMTHSTPQRRLLDNNKSVWMGWSVIIKTYSTWIHCILSTGYKDAEDIIKWLLTQLETSAVSGYESLYFINESKGCPNITSNRAYMRKTPIKSRLLQQSVETETEVYNWIRQSTMGLTKWALHEQIESELFQSVCLSIACYDLNGRDNLMRL